MDRFYETFCGVEFLCYQNEPNWLGWIVIVMVCSGIFVQVLLWLD